MQVKSLCCEETDVKNVVSCVTLTLCRLRAMSNVPTVSMFAAMIGTPVYVCPEFRNLYVRTSSTCDRQNMCSRIDSSRSETWTDLSSTFQGTPLRFEEHVFEIQLHSFLHFGHGSGTGDRCVDVSLP